MVICLVSDLMTNFNIESWIYTKEDNVNTICILTCFIDSTTMGFVFRAN